MPRSTLKAIQKGKSIAERGKSRANSRLYSSLASPNKLVRVFNQECKNTGYGTPLPLSKKSIGMLNGFIKLGRNNDWEEQRFYGIMKDIVKYWGHIKGMSLKTLNGKNMLLSDRPSLLEFLISRDSILSAIEELKSREALIQSNDIEEKESVRISRHREEYGPAAEEEEAEYEAEMERYLENL